MGLRKPKPMWSWIWGKEERLLQVSQDSQNPEIRGGLEQERHLEEEQDLVREH